MARGLPALWSSVLAAPFLAGGAYVYAGRTQFRPVAGVPVALFGAFVLAVGLYVHFVAAPTGPQLDDGEDLIAVRYPSQRVAVTRILAGVPFVVAGAYLLFETYLPYVYPTMASLVGGYFLVTGTVRYWKNTLTTYWLTTDRLIKEYRFVGLSRSYVPLDEVRGVTESKTATEALVGLGHIAVATAGSGSSGTTEVTVRGVPDVEEFATEIRRAPTSALATRS